MHMRMRTAALLCAALLFFCMGGDVAAAPTGAPAISSLSAAVYVPQGDLWLYEKDARTARPMASTTKLMTALVASHRLDAAATVKVPAAALPVEGTQVGLRAGQEIAVHDLLAALLLESGNDAANALALTAADSYEDFAAMMNAEAQALGMTDSTFVTPSGLDAGDHAASARDMALLGAAVLDEPLLATLCASPTATIRMDGRSVTVNNHNKLLRRMEGCIGLKTGFTKKSGRCLVSAVVRDGITVVIATLNGGDYWNDHMALYEYAFSLIERQPMAAPVPATLPIAGGIESVVPITWAPPDIVSRRDAAVRVTVELPAFVWAPVAMGETVGCVRATVGEHTVTAPIVAAADVAACAQPSYTALWWRRLRQLLDGLFC